MGTRGALPEGFGDGEEGPALNPSRSAFRALGRIGIGPILVLAGVLRLVPLIVHNYLRPLPQGTADAVRFERLAWEMSQGTRGALWDYIGSAVNLLAYLGSLIYDVTGRQPVALSLAMVVLGVAMVYVVYRIVFDITCDSVASRVAALATAVFPQLVLHSVLFLREIPVAFLLLVGFWGATRFLTRQSLPGLVVFCASTFLATLFHTGAIIAIPGLLLGTLIARSGTERRGFGRLVVNATAVMALLGVITFMDQTGIGLGKFGGSFDSAMDVFETSEARSTMGGAAYPEWMRIRGGIESEGWKIPIRYMAFLFSPLVPFLVRGGSHLLGVLDAGLYMVMFGVILRNWRGILQNRALLALLVMGLSLAFVYALGVSNFGTAIRHRAKIVPLFIVISVSVHALLSTRAPAAIRFSGKSLDSRIRTPSGTGSHTARPPRLRTGSR